jgi:hypothetical protein
VFRVFFIIFFDLSPTVEYSFLYSKSEFLFDVRVPYAYASRRTFYVQLHAYGYTETIYRILKFTFRSQRKHAEDIAQRKDTKSHITCTD